jgi:hypothetical protein
VPVVESPTTFTATGSATDPEGNRGRRAASSAAALPDGPPTVRVDCPTSASPPADYQ